MLNELLPGLKKKSHEMKDFNTRDLRCGCGTLYSPGARITKIKVW